ncbi:unnamed protein product [Anisakis simplex]|uniref:Protein enabled (inferred by orthology to a D. melanogaster protein) n=1 Tax=Anisakis simplex TaxID=6269 RepID=A0A0M3JWQ0_ANISI|nr:unnamed protein product [Anisakis simplex]
MVYDDSSKRWRSPDGCAETCRSQDREWILNCNIYERLKYNAATPTFHQWRDEKRKVYGLSFMAEDDARLFVNVMAQAMAMLSSANNDYQNGSELGLSNGIYHEPQLHHNAHSAPSFRDADQDSICSTATTATLTANNYRKSSQSIQSSSSSGAALLCSAQRRASQGSSTSSGSSNTTTNTIYATTAHNTPATTSHMNSPSRIPPAPPPPPPLSQLTTGGSSSTNSQYLPHHAQTHSLPNNTINTSNSNLANGAIPQAPPLPPGGIVVGDLYDVSAAISTNAPPAPPPPPLSTLSTSKGGGNSIAEQIKRVQLRKTSAPAISANGAQQQNSCTAGVMFNHCDGTNKASMRHAAWEKPLASVTAMNGSNTAASVLDSPKNHRNIGRAPSGSSISSQDEQQPSRNTAVITNGIATSNESLLEKIKLEILSEMRMEIEKAKCEIIQALRTELQQKR